MPILGKEEPAAFPRQFSNNNAGAGIPIKKRRFPMLPPSPPHQEPTENDSVDNQNNGSSQRSTFMDSIVASNLVEKFSAVKNPHLEVKKEIVVDPSSKLVSTISVSKIDVSVAKSTEPNVATQSDFNAKSQLNFVPKETIASVREHLISKQVSLKCKPEPFASTDEYALGPKEPLVRALMGQNREVSPQIPDNLYPSLSLSLSKEKCIDRSKNVENSVNNDTVVSSNRANWDLNTTMDAWDGSVGDAPHLDTVGFNGLNKIVGSLDSSPSLVSQSEIGVNVDLGKQILATGDCKPDFPVSSLPSTQYRAEDLLCLSLSPSFTRTNFSIKPSGSSANMPFGSFAGMPFASSSNLVSGSSSKLASGLSCNLSSSSSTNMPSGSSANIAFGPSSKLTSGLSTNLFSGSSASMPSDSSSANIAFGSSANMNSGSSAIDYSKVLGQDSVTATVNSVKKEVEGCSKNDFAVPNAISPNVVEDRPIKSEPTQDINKATPRLTESLINNLLVAGTVLQSQENVSVTTRGALKLEKSCSSGLPSSSGLSSSSDVSNQEHSVKIAVIPVQDKSTVNVSELQNSCGNAKAIGSDDEKNNILSPMMEEDSSGSGSESDGHATKVTSGGKEEEEYEDGEVREALVKNSSLVQKTTLNVHTNEREENSADCGDRENSNLSSLGLIDNVNLNQDPVEDKDREDVISEDHSKECIDSGVEDRSDQILDEIHADGPYRLVRDRFQDQSFRGSRMKFVRGRGRAYNRFDRNEWVTSDRKFNQENYSGPAEYRFSRNRHASAGDEEFESDGYPMAQDENLVASGIGGRKPLNDDFPSFRDQALRRISPRGRVDGPTARGIQMVRRDARNISPSGDKFNRNFPDDIVGPMFTRYQNSNEGLEDQFPRGNRKLSFVQRRNLPRGRSKSPMRTRTRSPGPWSSPRRRSPDGYNRIRELPRLRRSPPIYRMERVRSPPLNFPDEIVSRRRGSPPYIARPSNDFQRPIISNRRSPSDRPMPRNNRRFDNSLDLQERTNSGKYYEGPMRASRFDEIEEEGTGDDRRRFSERRGGRGFGGENFRFRQQSGPRPFRFGPKGDSEFGERSNNSGNLRDRDFDRRIKNRPLVEPRRIRGVDEQEGDFRPSGPLWHDDSFGDDYRGKRRRF